MEDEEKTLICSKCGYHIKFIPCDENFETKGKGKFWNIKCENSKCQNHEGEMVFLKIPKWILWG